MKRTDAIMILFLAILSFGYSCASAQDTSVVHSYHQFKPTVRVQQSIGGAPTKVAPGSTNDKEPAAPTKTQPQATPVEPINKNNSDTKPQK